ncbi:acyloxyacyl hydrolase [Tunicatimonas pelagia]|uniref:acyloxyacyl hydrolase n=1 Tax=Tunicatimonas pelagia TaxID=931531 RepID=UPI00266558A6|nr:acyloxyacyl hydrolase [Tunicatimonas pelagia]WKN41874.1 acyloxyacyl hydrolase [Tunicatimonas pelagia]
MKISLIVASLFLVNSLGCLAQENTPYVGVKSHVGFIIPHATVLQSLANSTPWGIGLEAGRVLKSADAWASCNCFTKVGVGVTYFDFQNPQELGQSYNLTMFGEPYLSFRKNWFITLRGEVGVSYLTKIYDEITNPNNLFFGSSTSFIGLASLTLNYRLQEDAILRLSANYNHISNGGIRSPNKGMNFPTLSLGVEKHFGDQQFPTHARQPGLRVQPWHRYLYLGGSRRSLEANALYKRSSYLNLGIETGALRPVSNINGFLAGAELYYNGAKAEQARRENNESVPLRLSLTLGHALVFGKLSFTQQMGYNAYQPQTTGDKSFFQRYAIYYQLGKLLNAGVSLKVHGHVADFIDMRVGIRW